MELCLEEHEFFLPMVHVLKFGGKKVRDVLTGHVARLPDGDDAANFGQRKGGRLSGTDELQARDRRFAVLAVAVPITRGVGQQAAAFVEPNRLGGYAARNSEVSDLHMSISPFDLVVRCNAYREDMEITLQYFDGCPNWTIAAERLAVIAAERPGVIVSRQLVESPEDAEAIGFRGSPSILINGQDLFPDPSAAVGLACRIYATPAGFAGAPTLEQLRETISAA